MAAAAAQQIFDRVLVDECASDGGIIGALDTELVDRLIIIRCIDAYYRDRRRRCDAIELVDHLLVNRGEKGEQGENREFRVYRKSLDRIHITDQFLAFQKEVP